MSPRLTFWEPKVLWLRRAGPLSCLCLPSSGITGAGYFTQLPHGFEQRSSCLFSKPLTEPITASTPGSYACAGCFQRVELFSSGTLFELDGQPALFHVVTLEHCMTEKEKRVLCEHRESSHPWSFSFDDFVGAKARHPFDHSSLFRSVPSGWNSSI